MEVSLRGDVTGRAVTYSGQQFQTLEGIKDYIDTLSENEKYSVQADLLEQMVSCHTKMGDWIESMFDYIKQSGAYRRSVTEEEFADTWQGVVVIIRNNEDKRDKHAEAKRRILTHWTTPLGIAWVQQLGDSASFMAEVRRLSSQFGFEDATRRINVAVTERLGTCSRGISNTKSVTTSDITKARGYDTTPGHPSATTLARHGLQIGRFGLVEESDRAPILITEVSDTQESPASADHTPDALTPAGDFPSPAGEIVGHASDITATQTDFPRHSSRPTIPARLTVEEAADFQIPGADEDVLNEGAIEEAERELDVPSSGGSDVDTESDTASEKGATEGTRTRQGGCKCSSDVTAAWKTIVMKKKVLGLATDMRLLAAHQSFRRVCYSHSKAMGGHIGLMLKKLTAPMLAERLREVHNGRHRIGRLKTDPETYRWFRVANRPPRPSDSLGPYRFAPVPLPPTFHYDQAAILKPLPAHITADWERDGTVNVDLFSWWFSGPIGNIIYAEFDMYRFHLREINGKSNYGWLRSMFYSIGQQLMRQDPMYYMLYAALRPDKQWRLVSYPYYAKYAVKGDLTYFRHLDLNIPKLIANARGADMIQGSVSLDNEDETNCTVLIPGMQRPGMLSLWWERCQQRGQETDGFVHRITEQMFTREDSRVLGLDWRKVPCKRGEVRITTPHLPHGADGPSTGTRRTMLPWFVGVQDDHETLEVLEGGTWSELSEAHRDLQSPKATPSGLANRYGAIPYRFPAAVEIAGLGAISDALVCRRRWDSPMVKKERDVLLGSDRAQAHSHIEQWRARAAEVAAEAFEAVVAAEKLAFGEKSYFYHLERCRELGIAMPVVEPDDDDMSGADITTDKTVAMAFAEEGAT